MISLVIRENMLHILQIQTFINIGVRLSMRVAKTNNLTLEIPEAKIIKQE